MKAAQAGSIRSALKVASSTAFAADALRKTAAATVYRASKNIVFFLSLDPPQPALAYRIPVSISVQSAFLDTR
jgi:hypothetical protein